MVNTGLFHNAAEPFTIFLTEGPYLFSGEMLKRDTDSKVQRKRDWFYPKLDFISFGDGTLKLLNAHRGFSHELTIVIDPDKLQVSCNCGIEAETLCVHAFKALERLTWFGETDFFRDYRPGGIIETALSHKKHFDISQSDLSLKINPKAGLGGIFQLSNKLGLPAGVLSLAEQAQQSCIEKKDIVLSYMLVNSYREELLPFLLPCIGYLNKAGTYIKGFGHFISGVQKEYDAMLTNEQRTLNRTCYDMWQLAEKIPGSLKEATIKDGRLKALFQLWQTASPLLQRQAYLYSYYLSQKKKLKKKPEKSNADQMEIFAATPCIYFALLDKGEYFRLAVQVSVKENILEKFSADHIFFIRSEEKLYLLASLRDAFVIDWMGKIGNCITIFKEHFPEFEQEFLNPLRENYRIEVINNPPHTISKTKKQG